MPPKEKVVVTHPEQGEYQRRIDEAKGSSVPVGGAPMPTIPPLGGGGGQAARERGVQGAAIVTPEQREELARRGVLRQGVGAAYAANQPGLAGAQQPRGEGEGGIRQETLDQLEHVAQYNQEQQAEAELQKQIKEAEGEFDFDDFGSQAQDLLQNKQRRDAIDARCEPLNFADLLVHQELRQVVPIIPGQYFPTFRTMGGDEDLFVKHLMAQEKDVSNQFFLDKYSAYQLCAGLYAVNGQVFGEAYMNRDGDIDEKKFLAKFKRMLRYPAPLLADMSVNYVWFVRRVRKTMSVDVIKGF